MADQVKKYVGVLSTKEIKVGSQERGQQVRLAVRMECVAFGLKCTHNRYNFDTSLLYMHVRIFKNLICKYFQLDEMSWSIPLPRP